MMSEFNILRELFQARFDSLDAKLSSMLSMFEKENDRQDETIERLADRTTHVNETRRLEQRIVKLESQIEDDQRWLNDINYKVKVGWAAGVALSGFLMSLVIAIVKGWIGV